jgi:uncharacterized membrane protein (UPF0127 family)
VRIALILLLLVSCTKEGLRDDAAKQSPPDVGPAQPARLQSKVGMSTANGEVVVDVEVVSTPAKLQQGLMYREHLAPMAGMLFLMGTENDHAFYMRNTLIPLDMIFITKDMTIAGIVQNAVPKTEDLRSVGKPSLYVLEVNGGWTAAHHVMAGAKVRFENVTPR